MAPVQDEGLKDAREQLALILGFFPRVDAKLTAVLGVDTAVIATLSASAPGYASIRWPAYVAAGLTLCLMAGSFYNLYRGAFPALSGGGSSLIFFRQIACRTEANFLRDYSALSQQQKRDDVLGQVWRNSEILVSKYRSLKAAFIAMACGLVPWVAALVLFAMERSAISLMVVHK